MTWVRLDDGFADHPKVALLSVKARWQYVRGLCYAARYLTDGEVPIQIANAWEGRAASEGLVDAGLWTRRGSSYWIHDYLDWNPSREDVETRRREDSERKKRGKSGRNPSGIREDSSRAQDGTGRTTGGLGVEGGSGGEIVGKRPRDELFEVVCEVCGIDWHELTPMARGSLNKAVGELRALHPEPADVRRRAANWPYDTPLTPPSLAKHWPALTHRRNGKAQPDRVANVQRNLDAMRARGEAE